MNNHLVFLVVIIALYLVYWFIDYNQRKRNYIKNKSFDHLHKLLNVLSADMNNQILLLETVKRETILKIHKYQNGNLWGIKIVLGFNNRNKYLAPNDVYSQLNETYNSDKIYISSDQIVIDTSSDLIKANAVIMFIILTVLKLDPNSRINYLFEKKHVPILRI